MLTSERVRLRPMVPDDATVLYEMWSDPEHHLLTDDRPMLVESLAARRVRLEKSQAEPDVHTARFTAETIADGTVIGACSLWGLDAFNQFGHLGISLLPAARTQGYGREMVRLLCHYGFRFRNLHRIELETLATNAAMRKLAESCGFVLEGIQREQAYDGDGFSDVALYGLLRQEWSRQNRVALVSCRSDFDGLTFARNATPYRVEAIQAHTVAVPLTDMHGTVSRPGSTAAC